MRHHVLVEAAAGKFNDSSGTDQLTRMLNQDGISVSQPTVGAIMREQGLRTVRTRAWKKSTEQDPQAKTRISRTTCSTKTVSGTSPPRCPARQCRDTTYLKTDKDWLYLATVIDLCTGMVIDWNMDCHMRTDLCTRALAKPPPGGLKISTPIRPSSGE